MKKPDKDLDRALAEFASLSAADQRAVADLLSVEERGTLNRLLARSARSPEQAPRRPETADGLAGYSPWLAKRLQRIADPRKQAGAPGLTRATQAALNSLLSRQHAR